MTKEERVKIIKIKNLMSPNVRKDYDNTMLHLQKHVHPLILEMIEFMVTTIFLDGTHRALDMVIKIIETKDPKLTESLKEYFKNEVE